jgi:hypothetical protein
VKGASQDSDTGGRCGPSEDTMAVGRILGAESIRLASTVVPVHMYRDSEGIYCRLASHPSRAVKKLLSDGHSVDYPWFALGLIVDMLTCMRQFVCIIWGNYCST